MRTTIKVINSLSANYKKSVHKCASRECNLNNKVIKESKDISMFKDSLCDLTSSSKVITVNNKDYLISQCKHDERIIGIDLNSRQFLTTSNNQSFDLHKTKQYIEKYKQNNKSKYLDKIKNVRFQELTNICNYLIHNYDVIVLEDLGLVSKEKDITQINNYVYSLFRSMIVSKAHLFDKEIRFVGNEFKSSQICSSCQSTNKISIDNELYKCSNCYLVMNRDLNAAKNIVNGGY